MSDDLIEGLTGSDPCQDVGGEPPFEPFDCFVDDDRGHDKNRLTKFLTHHPESVPIARCVEPLLLTCSSPNYARNTASTTPYFPLMALHRSKTPALVTAPVANTRNTTVGVALNVSFVR
ncbi:hypothetical protein [Halolamina salifodinae]|uniref:Uncharacterized protein n=1 Tax=Halolamina salifodinae TaxID=1202767 RepID=A0A8T4H0B5_9EURY|nr:hypothetical protein [Halolamina salifodinae]